MKRAILLVVLFAAAVHAQSISPTAEEFGKKAKGQFTVENKAYEQLTVTVEAYSFVMENGQAVLRPLDPTVQVKLKETTFKLGPQQTHFVDYDATCTVLPCHFELMANFSPAKHDGLTIAYHLGTAAYICEKEKHCRLDTLKGMQTASK